MKYPSIPHDEKLSVKIPLRFHDQIISMRKSGMFYKDIAKKFDVSDTAIRSIVNQQEYGNYQNKYRKSHPLNDEQKQKNKKIRNVWGVNRYSADENFVKYCHSKNKKNYRSAKH